jgi:hypothetical protein
MVTRGLGMILALQEPMPTSYRIASFDGNGWHSKITKILQDCANCGSGYSTLFCDFPFLH